MKFWKWRWPALFVTVIPALSAYWFTQEWLGPRVDGYAVVKEELIQTIVAGGKFELPSGVEISSRVNGMGTGSTQLSQRFATISERVTC